MAEQDPKKAKREYHPSVLQTKQELLVALKSGNIKSTKYNLLNDREKMFVELMVFGDYTATQAMKVIDPATRHAQMLANKMLANSDVADTLEELSIQKDKKFMSEVASGADLGLSKLKYIMATTESEELAAACAKTLLETKNKMAANNKKNEEPVSHVQFNIKVDKMYTRNTDEGGLEEGEPVILPIEDADEEVQEIARKSAGLPTDDAGDDSKPAPPKKKSASKPKDKPLVDPKTGLPYTIRYEGVDAYNKKDPGE